MTYREPPSTEELFRLLNAANKEKEESAARIKELESKLTSISTAIKDHDRKITYIDVSKANSITEIDNAIIAQKKALESDVNTSMVDPYGFTVLKPNFPKKDVPEESWDDIEGTAVPATPILDAVLVAIVTGVGAIILATFISALFLL